MASEDDARLNKLPRWAQVLIRKQQETISALQSVNGTGVPDPWLYSQGASLELRPLAGTHDLQVRYGPDPAGLNGQYGIRLRPGRNRRTLEVLAINGGLIVRPHTSNHVEIILEREPGMPDDDFWS